MNNPNADDDDSALERRRQRARARAQAGGLGGLQGASMRNGSSVSLASSHSSAAPGFPRMNSASAKRMEEIGRLRRLQSQQTLAPTGAKGPLRHSTDVPTSVNLLSPGSSRPRPDSEPLPPYTSPIDSTFSHASHFATSELDTEEAERQLSGISNRDHASMGSGHILDSRVTQLLRDLEATKAALSHAAAVHQEEKQTLLKRLVESEQQFSERLQEQKRAHLETRAELEQARNTISSLTLEKRGWQAKLDSMNARVQEAHRLMRTVDHITRAKLASQQAELKRTVRRAKHIMNVSPMPSMEVLEAVAALNEEIFQLANIFVENLQRVKLPYTDDNLQRARSVLGDSMSTMMAQQSVNNQQGFHYLLMQVALEVFMTSWCSSIIDGQYPQQKSFGDLLLELSGQPMGSNTFHTMQLIQCGSPIQVIHTNDKSVMPAKFAQWVDDIISDLAQILRVAGLTMRPQRSEMFQDKFLGLTNIAYNLRAALAERDICGSLEICIAAPDTPFQSKWMNEAHEGQTPISALETHPIVGTCALGLKLQRQSSTEIDFSPMNIVMKPKVVLLSILQDN